MYHDAQLTTILSFCLAVATCLSIAHAIALPDTTSEWLRRNTVATTVRNGPTIDPYCARRIDCRRCFENAADTPGGGFTRQACVNRINEIFDTLDTESGPPTCPTNQEVSLGMAGLKKQQYCLAITSLYLSSPTSYFSLKLPQALELLRRAFFQAVQDTMSTTAKVQGAITEAILEPEAAGLTLGNKRIPNEVKMRIRSTSELKKDIIEEAVRQVMQTGAWAQMFQTLDVKRDADEKGVWIVIIKFKERFEEEF